MACFKDMIVITGENYGIWTDERGSRQMLTTTDRKHTYVTANERSGFINQD
jgi:hypothetical protein